jgi:hypothetical protein
MPPPRFFPSCITRSFNNCIDNSLEIVLAIKPQVLVLKKEKAAFSAKWAGYGLKNCTARIAATCPRKNEAAVIPFTPL